MKGNSIKNGKMDYFCILWISALFPWYVKLFQLISRKDIIWRKTWVAHSFDGKEGNWKRLDSKKHSWNPSWNDLVRVPLPLLWCWTPLQGSLHLFHQTGVISLFQGRSDFMFYSSFQLIGIGPIGQSALLCLFIWMLNLPVNILTETPRITFD